MSNEHEYAFTSLAMLLFAAALLIYTKRLRGLLLAAGFLAIPYALASSLFIPAYWDPPVLFRVIASPEDLAFSFSCGVIACWLPYVLFAHELEFTVDWKRVLRRYLGYSLVGFGITSVLMAVLGVTHIMHSTLAGMAAVSGLLLLARRELLPISVIGAGAFPAFYGFVLAWWMLTRPEFFAHWTPSAQLPFAILEVPAFEVIWAFFYGVCWPALVAHAFDLRIRPLSAAGETIV